MTGARLPERCREFTLASIATAWPSSDSVETLLAMNVELSERPEFAGLLAGAHRGVESMRAAYLRCLDTSAGGAPAYETEYGRMRGLSKGKDLADVVGFYNAFGFALSDEIGNEMPDHIAIELEFYALLLFKQDALVDDPDGVAIVDDARRKFLQDHLGGFAPALANRPAVSADPTYGPLLAWVAALVGEECRVDGVRAAPVDFFEADDASEPANCGGCVAIPGAGA